VIDFCVPCVQDERDASRPELLAKVTAVAAKDSGCKVRNIGQVGMGVLDQHGLFPFCFKRISQASGDHSHPFNDQDDATMKGIVVGHWCAPSRRLFLNHEPRTLVPARELHCIATF